MIKTDCIHFPLDRPCSFHKESGRTCSGCAAYIPVARRTSSHKKILIIKLGAMGDVLRTTFLLPGLKELFPRAEITWIVAKGSEPILEGNPHITAILPADNAVFPFLAQTCFDTVINLDLAPESLAWATLAIARRKIGYWLDPARKVVCSNTHAARWLELSANDSLKKANTRTYQYWMARITGLPRADYEIYVPLLSASVRKAAAFARKHHLAGTRVIGINPGAGKRWKLKKWNDEGYLRLMHELIARKYKILLLGGPEEKELIAGYVRQTRGKAVSAGTGNSLPDFFALLNRCSLLITGDTLAMHAALGLKKKVVSIFGPTSSAEIEMYGRGCKIVSPAACVCCYRPSCQVTPDCMSLISATEVSACVFSLLGERSGAAR